MKSFIKVLWVAIASGILLLVGGFFVFLAATDGSSAYRQKIDECIQKRKE